MGALNEAATALATPHPNKVRDKDGPNLNRCATMEATLGAEVDDWAFPPGTGAGAKTGDGHSRRRQPSSKGQFGAAERTRFHNLRHAFCFAARRHKVQEESDEKAAGGRCQKYVPPFQVCCESGNLM